ncbi:MAG: hypothetical protein WAL32_05235 [Terriglobales bacterium]
MKKLSISAFSGKILRSELGQGLAEYALMLGLLLSLLFIAKAVGNKADSLFQRVLDIFQ